ncbi:MAG: substrate-binding domain-containing protein [Verrucomicrobiae bacterium]|nr:substrate-binding domain-containing protein [Verrucomicrobiae bacterium]
MNKNYCLLLTASAALLLLASCGGGSQTESGADASASVDSSKVIGYSMLSSANPFFKVISRSMTEEAAKHGYTVVAVSGDLDLEKQRQQVDDFIARKVAAIVLNPCDSKGIGPVIEKANEAGIPVFTCDIKSLASTGKVVAHIATDNFAGGRLAGEAMIEALSGNGGKIAIIDYKDAESCLLRVAGFKEVIEQHNAQNPGAKFEIVRELGGEGDLEKGRTAAQDIVQAVPDIDGIFAINDPSGLGAWSALDTAGKAESVVLIGFDGQPDGKKAVQAGKFYASPIQFPSMMGKQTIDTIVKYFNGEAVESEQLISPMIYKQEDANNDPDIDSWGFLQNSPEQGEIALVHGSFR